MTRINRLTSRAVDTISEPGLYPDGLGLNLRVGKGKRWVLIYQWRGKRREMGLGSATGKNLALARRDAQEARDKIKAGIDPIADRRATQMNGVTFGEVAEDFIASKSRAWRNPKHTDQWGNTLTAYASRLQAMPVSDITTDDVLLVLRPIWQSIPETASRVRGRIENILDAAKARGLRCGENPAAWKGNLAHLLPARGKLTRGHHKAIAYEQMPDFWAGLTAAAGVAAKALQFTILTAARTSETRGAVWNEIDWERRIWTVPGSRMKAGVAHRVPLSDAALSVLYEMKPLSGDYIFPAHNGGQLSLNAMSSVLKRMSVDATVHGFRSSFRDWAGEETDFPRDVIEMALAHTVGSKVERAYRRGDALERRRRVMEEWADHVSLQTRTGDSKKVRYNNDL